MNTSKEVVIVIMILLTIPNIISEYLTNSVVQDASVSIVGDALSGADYLGMDAGWFFGVLLSIMFLFSEKFGE